MKIRPVGVELFYADGQTDKHNWANTGSRLSQFANAPNNAVYFPQDLLDTSLQDPSWRSYLIISHIGHVIIIYCKKLKK
jgi:hypothetical protein